MDIHDGQTVQYSGPQYINTNHHATGFVSGSGKSDHRKGVHQFTMNDD